MGFDIQYYSPSLLEAYGQIAHNQGAQERKDKERYLDQRDRELDIQADRVSAYQYQRDMDRRLKELQDQRRADLEELKGQAQANQMKAVQQQYMPELQGNYDFAYTPTQRRKVAQLNTALQEVMTNKRLRPQQRQELANRIYRQMADIMPMPQLRDTDAPTIQKEMKSRVFQDPQSGSTYILQQDGSIDHIPKNKSEELTFDIFGKWYEMAYKTLTTKNEENQDIPPNATKVQEFVRNMFKDFQELTGKVKKEEKPQPLYNHPVPLLTDPNGDPALSWDDAMANGEANYSTLDERGPTSNSNQFPGRVKQPYQPLKDSQGNVATSWDGVIPGKKNHSSIEDRPKESSWMESPTVEAIKSYLSLNRDPFYVPPSLGMGTNLSPRPVQEQVSPPSPAPAQPPQRPTGEPFLKPGDPMAAGLLKSPGVPTSPPQQKLTSIPASNRVTDFEWMQLVGPVRSARDFYTEIFVNGKSLNDLESLWNGLSTDEKKRLIRALSALGVLEEMKRESKVKK